MVLVSFFERFIGGDNVPLQLPLPTSRFPQQVCSLTRGRESHDLTAFRADPKNEATNMGLFHQFSGPSLIFVDRSNSLPQRLRPRVSKCLDPIFATSLAPSPFLGQSIRCPRRFSSSASVRCSRSAPRPQAVSRCAVAGSPHGSTVQKPPVLGAKVPDHRKQKGWLKYQVGCPLKPCWYKKNKKEQD